MTDDPKKKRDDGGPAFPRTMVGTRGESRDYQAWAAEGGMSLRDWFAGQALAGFLAAGLYHRFQPGPGDAPEKYTALAYNLADAMIAARKAGA